MRIYFHYSCIIPPFGPLLRAMNLPPFRTLPPLQPTTHSSEFRSAVAAYAELKREDEGLRGEDAGPSNAAPSRLQLGSVALVAGVPFIFFGFMDNAGMLVFGEAVDMTLGHRLGLSAMASAACGEEIEVIFL